ncbi:unnamed protein product [Aureobasidium uvarum]|uniref:Uncharacterized protein n=1 Tax=Aureobasidium uvarum TaxID=2773716 RepID=A0A9N8KKA7_9PEZI|nr:unnamed protein product [Aureobasidium uvarum]
MGSSYSSDSDSDDSIPRYGGYKHSNPNYEDFEMWNSVCEDAEPDWEYKEAQREEKRRQKRTKRKPPRRKRKRKSRKKGKERNRSKRKD